MKRAIALLIAFALSACIPAGSPPPERTPISAPEVMEVPLSAAPGFSEKPAWEMRPATANAVDIAAGSYVVRPGDTLHAVGAKTGVGAETLARANGLQPPYALYVRQVLTIPAGRYHTVLTGETGIAIAQVYGVKWADVIALNGLVEPFVLRVGQRLALPGQTASLPAASPATGIEARAAAFRIDIDDLLTGADPATETASLPAPVRAPAPLNGQFVWPVSGKIASRFGVLGEGVINQGIDIAVAKGAPISAANNGTVAFVGDRIAGYGGLILIKHSNGWITAYGRAADAVVKRGDAVKRGDVIGHAGSGASPHLFFQMRKDRVPVDPLRHLPAR